LHEENQNEKIILFQEVYHNFVVIGFACYDLYLFGDVINCHEDILVSMRHREGTHEVDAQTSKILTTKIGGLMAFHSVV